MTADNSSIEDLLQKAVPQVTPPEEAEEYEEKMKEIRIKEREELAQKSAASLGIPYISLKGFPISPETLSSIPEETAKKLKAICFLNTGTEIRLGAVDPENPEVKELVYQLGERFRGHSAVYLISEHSFNLAFELYKAVPKIRKIVKGVTITEEELKKYQEEIKSFKDLHEKIQEASITDVVSMVIAFSLRVNASDIHIEAEEANIRIRFRLDGVLIDVGTLPKKEWERIAARIKLLAGLKINITDKPQDGRFTIFTKEGKAEVRTSTLPSAYGESVVMRLLRPEMAALDFEQLGLRGRSFQQLKQEIERPSGMIIATGPTGSGKTTTLYAILKKLNKPEVKIITLEDPIEYKLEGISQSQIDVSKDYTFAKGLRSILRQDPDIVMVGEVRDLETAEISIQAALTGHLVISTLHTNDASGAVPRFLAIGAKPFLLAPAVNLIIGQRLVRRICAKCKVEEKLDEGKNERVKKILNELPKDSEYKIDTENLRFYKGGGCEECSGIGFKGRIGIYEILTMNKDIEKLILSGKAPSYQMKEIAVSHGMITMAQDGLLKALEGITSVEEVFRVVE